MGMIRAGLHSLLPSVALFGIMAGSTVSVMADESNQLCDISIAEIQCGPVAQVNNWKAFEFGEIFVVLGESLAPMHASIDEKSMSLIFNMGEERLLFITRHNLPHDDLSPLVKKMDPKSSFIEERCSHDDTHAMHCLFLGEGKHLSMQDKRFSDVLYFGSKGSLHGHVSRAYVFDKSGLGYFDVMISPAIDCSMIGFFSPLTRSHRRVIWR